jgi:hypothetical protein
MSETAMINFRIRKTDLQKLDQAAQTLGLTRSDFLRQATSDLINTATGADPVEKTGTRGKQQEKAVFLNSTCPKNDYCRFIKNAKGTKTCQTCGYTRT